MSKYPNRREVLTGTASIAAAAALPVPVIASAAAAVELPLPRHVETIRAHAARAGFKLISEFYDSNGRVKKITALRTRARSPKAGRGGACAVGETARSRAAVIDRKHGLKSAGRASSTDRESRQVSRLVITGIIALALVMVALALVAHFISCLRWATI